jgi:hypothetical protein
MTTKYKLEVRKQITINTDPQRRCYDGVNAREEWVWTAWNEVCTYTAEMDAQDSAATFKQINPGREYRVVPVEVSP